ncbi:MAG: hypothetical protein CM15mP58_12650 [Burkholderiaceae bacterium]|nr:MAG: hypothetical protein CM15mP58_12650 [Burkholderiaceae bacterium]
MCSRFHQSSGTITNDGLDIEELIKRNVVAQCEKEGIRDIFPDDDANIFISVNNMFVKKRARWGFPPVRVGNRPITNIRNLNSWWWKDCNGEYLTKKEYRCVIPFLKFAEPPRKPTWFCIKNRSLSFFAGIWRPWHGERLLKISEKRNRVKTARDWDLFAFLTTFPNDIVNLTIPNQCPSF